MKGLTVQEICEIIPHRHPFLLVDYIEDYEPGEFAVGYKCVTYREDFFLGHFPQEPIMPGVLTVEALAQVGAVAILSKEENKGKIAYFGGIQKCKFKGKVVPGDKLKLETRMIKQKATAWNWRGSCQCEWESGGKCRIDLYDWIGERHDKKSVNCKQRRNCSSDYPYLQRNGN